MHVPVVTDAAVEAAILAALGEIRDAPAWPDAYNERERAAQRQVMRAALTAAAPLLDMPKRAR